MRSGLIKFPSSVQSLSKLFLAFMVIALTASGTFAFNVIHLYYDGQVYNLNSNFTGVVLITANNCKFNMHGHKITSYANKTNVGIYMQNVHGTRIWGDYVNSYADTGEIDNYNTAIYIEGGYDNRVYNVDIWNSNWGTRQDYSSGNYLYNVYAFDPPYDGHLMISTTNTDLEDAHSRDAGRFGTFATGGSGLWAYHCILQGSTNYDGWRIYNHSSPVLNDCVGSGCNLSGLTLNGNTSNGTFTYCQGFFSNIGVVVESGSLGHWFYDCEGGTVYDSHYRVGTSRVSNMNTYYLCDWTAVNP